MGAAEFDFTPNASPIVELGLGDTRVPTGTGVWDSALWDDPAAVWQGVEPSWWDVSCFAVEAEVARGRERAVDRFAAGTAGIVLDNSDGWADMAGDPGTIAAVSLRPGRAIRIGVDVSSLGRVWLFRGIIDRVTPNYDPIHVDYVKLDCIDLLGEVGHVKLIGADPVGPDDPVASSTPPTIATDRLNRLLDACRHPREKRVLADDATKLIATPYGTQAIDLLGQATDSAGGAIYADELGNIVYKRLGWQDYIYGTANDGSIGNILDPVPGTPAYTPPPYLEASGAPVTTPDVSSITLPNGFVVFAKVTMPTGGSGSSFLAGQWPTGSREWKIERARVTGVWSLIISSDGTASTAGTFTTVTTPPTGGDEEWALSVVLDDGSGHTILRAYRRVGGDDDTPVWAAADGPHIVAQLPWTNRTAPLSIGTVTGATAWPGRIYWVDLAAPETVSPRGASVWRFDVADTVAATSSWTDPRGRGWTVGGSSSGHIHPATIPATPGTDGDICPSGWEVSHDRMDLATQVELNRLLPAPVPQLRFNLGTAVGASSGQLNLNNSDQTLATSMSISFTSSEGTNAEPFIRNFLLGAEIRLTDVGDVTNNTRTYRVTGPGIFNTNNYIVPITWIDGVTGIGGLIQMVPTFVAPASYVADDLEGQSVYGVETYSLTDLISIDGALFPALGRRILASRGHTAMPRLEAVTLDARAVHSIAALELMAQCRPEKPSRYMCRLRHESGRIIFNRNMFAVGTRHHITRSEWTLRIGLDDASWAASPNGPIQGREANDQAAITGTVT